MPAPRTWLALSLALALLIAIRGAALLWPADLAATSPELDALRACRTQLAAYTGARLQALQAREGQLRKQLWTQESFTYWKKTTLPDGWLVQDLGPTEARSAQAHRYAFTRPGAGWAQWPETLALLGALEAHECIVVQNVSLAAKPGARAFSQCVIVAAFFLVEEPRKNVALEEKSDASHP
jgi:hypothetical protein